ncbi:MULTISPECIES: hypothetical protein [Rhodococcus]|uniref:hypothetical protein n=1 Tax=Rhodococcus rhodochrous TaxID=1829 RepID=UPI000E7436B2|nr:hypothetical protein [Rhodococcus rhodochrous]QHG81528.1 hypothetical protein D1O33_05970 [Rhodococcus rhodochrous]QOH58796.1 hypothetical protein C6Y44_24560 [Rhodococcus rhodochrous]
MKPGARVALGVGIGYFLGRTKKMRVAMMLAGAGMTGKLPSNPQELLQRSASMLGSSPEINKITESVRGELMHAARAAAVTAASNRIDALNERLQSRASGGGGGSEEPEDAEYEDEYDEPRDEQEGRGSKRRGNRSRNEEPDYDETDEEGSDEEDSGDEEEPEPERPTPRRRAARATSRPRTSRSKKTADSEDSDDSEEAPPKPRKRAARSTASSSSSGRAPVRRTKR